MNEMKLINLLSMAQRAGKLLSGEFAVTKALGEKKKRVRLLLVAADAAADTRERYGRLANDNKIDIGYILSREALGHCIGKEFRAVAAVIDEGFAKALLKLVREDG